MIEDYSNRMIGGSGSIRDKIITGESNIAREIGVSVSTIRIWKVKGGLPVKKLGGSCVISRAKLDSWVMDQL